MLCDFVISKTFSIRPSSFEAQVDDYAGKFSTGSCDVTTLQNVKAGFIYIINFI